MLLALLFSYIHDNSLDTHAGYFWSLICFLSLSFVSMYIKIQIGIWDQERGNIFNSSTPHEKFMAHVENQKFNQSCLDDDDSAYTVSP